MQKFQAIADANPSPADGHPSRNSGEPGYKASADYVAQVMKDAGYNVTIQTYKFTYYAYTGIPAFSEVVADASRLCRSHGVESRAEHGDGERGLLQPAGGIVIPPTPPRARRAAAPRLTSAASCRAGSR